MHVPVVASSKLKNTVDEDDADGYVEAWERGVLNNNKNSSADPGDEDALKQD